MKKCSKCGEEKDLKNFHKDKYNTDGFTYSCKDCRNGVYNKYYSDNPEKAKEKNLLQKDNRKAYYSSVTGIVSSRRAHLKRMYGITLEEYNALLKKQDHKCAICKGYESSYRNEVLSVDHNHDTGKIRGLLCNTCNRGLGLFKDNEENLINAINYLKHGNENK